MNLAQKTIKALEEVQELFDEAVSGEDVIAELRDIVKNHQAKKIKFADGSTMIDAFSASAVIQVFDSLSDKNKEKALDMIKTTKGYVKLNLGLST